MEVFLPGNIQQTLTIIPRYDSRVVSLSVRNEFTGDTQIYAIPYTYYLNGYMSIDFTHEFEEGDKYNIEVKDNYSELLWRGKATVTAQSTQNYRVNNDIIDV